jgi:hypothetical protein
MDCAVSNTMRRAKSDKRTLMNGELRMENAELGRDRPK